MIRYLTTEVTGEHRYNGFMHGALIIDKPAGWTSHDVVARARRIIGERRVGHTGTLDPFATGVLVLLIGQATRLAQFLSDAEKEYEAVIRLGYATDTGDATGKREEFHAKAQSSQSFSSAEIEAAMASLRGEISQTPPMFSAKKVGGRKLYELARAGAEVEREPIKVMIREFEALTSGDLDLEPDGTADLSVRVVCSAGTYVRTLAEDFGKSLGIGAHLSELRRTRAGAYAIQSAVTLERLEELIRNGSLAQVLIPSGEILAHLPFVKLSDEGVIRTRHGIDFKVEDLDSWEDDQLVRLQDMSGNLIAVGKFSRGEGSIHPQVVVNAE
jgi:tRNA pseudouridine55 synthase